MVIIGVAGPSCSGKSIITEYLRQKDFEAISLSNILREQAKLNNIELTTENLQNLGNKIREEHGAGALALIVLEKIDKNKNTVIESIRNPGEVQEFKKNKNFYLIGVDASRELRVERLYKRYNEGTKKEDPLTKDAILKLMDIDEGKEQNETGQQVRKCMLMADFHIFNDKDVENLKLETEKILNSIQNKRKRPDWDEYFMSIALQASKRATCDRKHVGAVIVKNKTILSTGYNGSIRNFPHCDDVGHMLEEGHCVATIHAEANSIVQAAKNGISIENATIYTTASPCWWCFKMIANAGIKKIVYGEIYRDERIKEFSGKANIELVSYY